MGDGTMIIKKDQVDKVRFDDGRTGTQQRYQDERGNWHLVCVNITHGADGRFLAHPELYAKRSFLSDGIRAISMMPKLTWEIIS